MASLRASLYVEIKRGDNDCIIKAVYLICDVLYVDSYLEITSVHNHVYIS